MNAFVYENWNLYEAIEALMAYDLGATDSGIKDEKLKKAIEVYLVSLSNQEFRTVVAGYARRYLTDEMLASGYGLEDVIDFVRWLNENRMNFGV